jgi:hypothetical protein
MIIQAINNTGGTLTYSNEGLTIPANSTITVPLDVINGMLFDGNVINDINLGNLSLGDGVNTYGQSTGLVFLAQACQFYNQSDKSNSGTLTAAQSTEATPVAGGTVVVSTNESSSVGIGVTGTWSGTIVFDGTIDGTNWFAISAFNLSTGLMVQSITANTNLIIGCGSLVQVRTRMSAYTSGTANVAFNAAIGNNVISVTNAIAATFNAQVVGSVASLGSNSGNPVKVGRVYNSSLPAPSSGKIVDEQANAFGESAVQFRNKYSHISGNGTTTVKSGAGRLHGIMINNTGVGASATLYDNTAGSGTVIAVLALSGTPEFVGPLGLEFSTGLTIVTSGLLANDLTILYQ